MRILVVDDHTMFAESIRLLLGARHHISTAFTGADALAQVSEKAPEVVLLDQKLPDIDGLTLLKVMRAVVDPPAVILLSGSDDAHLINQARDAGAAGFLHKSLSAEKLIEAIDRVGDGLKVWPQHANGQQEPVAPGRIGNIHVMKELGITERQLEVLQLLGAGAPNKTIASDLGIAESTVKTHIKSLFQVLKVPNRVACYNRARELGLLEESRPN